MAKTANRRQEISIFWYRFTQFVTWIVAAVIFKRKIVRNEIKNVKGPFVVIANHEAALDFVDLIGLTKRPMSFVISNSFYNSLPLKKIFDKVGVIPKQQFQTKSSTLKLVKSIVDDGEPVVIYPAGLMCEDGLSTPIPLATYKFLKWLNCDVYCAKVSGTYFAMPKWSKGLHPGRTFMDCYKLLTKEEVKALPVEELKEKIDEALLFDCYREQEKARVIYKGKGEIEGLEKVLYMCPNCQNEFTINLRNKRELYCNTCGFSEESDTYHMLKKTSDVGEEIRYVSDWSLAIQSKMKEMISSGVLGELKADVTFQLLNYDNHKFYDAGVGTVSLGKEFVALDGTLLDKPFTLKADRSQFPTLPFSPGKHLEVQDGDDIYRLKFKDGKLVMKFINAIKAYYQLEQVK